MADTRWSAGAAHVGRWLSRAGLWAVDYAVITAWQLRGLLAPGDADRYRTGRAGAAPVVLVPGIYETWSVFRRAADALHDHGHPVHPVPTLGYNHGPVSEMARRSARLMTDLDLDGVVLVAHSKGGLIGKALMLDPLVGPRVSGMVAVNAPFAGSRYASWLPLPSVRALAPRHPSVLELAAQREVNHRITSVFPEFDPHVPGGSWLPGGCNVEVATTGHFRTLAHPEVLAAVLAGVHRHAR